MGDAVGCPKDRKLVPINNFYCMLDFISLVKRRRSMRKFTPGLLDSADLNLILKAALMSPSSKGLHSWEFVLVTEPGVLCELAKCKTQGAEFLAEAPEAVVVLGDPAVSDVWIEDASVASTMMLLQAEDLGLGSCWVQIRGRFDAEGRPAGDNVKRLLEIPENLEVLSIIALGRKGMERKPFNEERLLMNKIHMGVFSNPFVK